MIEAAAAGTVTNMVTVRLMQEAFAATTDTHGLINDYHSDVVKCIKGQEERSKVWPKLIEEFVV